jgi:zonular occludens toxin Zot
VTITLRTAPPGGGKSYTSVRNVVNAILEGKCVAGNVELVPDWPERIARHHWPFWIRRRRRRRFLREARERYHFTDDLGELFRLRLAGRGEGRGLMVLDEAHNWMNARSWSAEDRKEIVRFFTQHRKLGWDVELIAQDAEMIDKQVRVLAEYIAYGRNMKKAKWGGVRIFPFNLFMVVVCWHASQRVVVERKFFRLTKWIADLYDHEATFGGLNAAEADGGVIPFPSPPEDRGQRPAVDGRTRPGAAGRPAPAPLPPAAPADEGHVEHPDGDQEGEPETWSTAPSYEVPAP